MDRTAEARSLMLAFADATGLTGERAANRYLWTDAHAVCNFLALDAATGDAHFRRLALELIDQVHETLGRHRPDDARSGWISGLDGDEARRHPTAGGLRIGKPLPERRPDERYDPQAEWDQDGQYYHYLTKWMHALLQTSHVTEDARYLDWAIELAQVAYTAFHAPMGAPRLYWKMSIDLSHPLVPSSGLHDPLDGLVTALTLASALTGAAASDTATSRSEALERLIVDLGKLCSGSRWETDDPLGLGGLLFDAARLAQLDADLRGRHVALLGEVLDAARAGIRIYLRSRPLAQPAWQRLAFRELGLAIGLHAIEIGYQQDLPASLVTRLDELNRYVTAAADIEAFWLEPQAQRQPTWQEHRDISSVMLATSLLPAGFLKL